MGLRIGIGTNLRIQGVGGLPYPDVLLDGNTVGWYDYLLGITRDGADLISAWNSIIGANHLLQAVGANQPLWTADGVLTDGIDNFMKCIAFPWNQPEFIYMVVRQVTWISGNAFFDGNVAGISTLRQRTATPNIALNRGAVYIADNNDLILNTWSIVRALFSGVNSKIIVNNGIPTTGDFGTTSHMGGFTLGSRGNGTDSFCSFQAKEIINRSSVDGEAAIYAYLAAKYSI